MNNRKNPDDHNNPANGADLRQHANQPKQQSNKPTNIGQSQAHSGASDVSGSFTLALGRSKTVTGNNAAFEDLRRPPPSPVRSKSDRDPIKDVVDEAQIGTGGTKFSKPGSWKDLKLSFQGQTEEAKATKKKGTTGALDPGTQG